MKTQTTFLLFFLSPLDLKGIITPDFSCTPAWAYHHHSKYFNQRKCPINREETSLKLPVCAGCGGILW
jgi:hypothetical protein